MKWSASSLICWWWVWAPLMGQGSAADYERSARLQNLWPRLVGPREAEPHWFDGGDRFWWRRPLADGGHEFVVVDCSSGTSQPAFDAAALATALSQEFPRSFDPRRLPLDDLRFGDAGQVYIQYGEHQRCWNGSVLSFDGVEVQPENGTPRPGSPRGRGRREAGRASPDGTWRVETREDGLFLMGPEGESRVGPAPGDGAGWVVVRWAPDSHACVVSRRSNPAATGTVLGIRSTPEPGRPAELESRSYVRPGDPMTTHQLFLLQTGDKKLLPIETAPLDFGDVRVRWWRDSSACVLRRIERGHQRDQFLEVDGVTGSVRVLTEETSATFIDHYTKNWMEFVDETREIFFLSERSGWAHIFCLRDGVVRPVTTGSWVVRSVEHFDPASRTITFTAGGLDEGQDPYLRHHLVVGLDGTGLRRLTESPGDHRLSWSPNRKWYVDTWCRVDHPPVSELRCAEDGRLITELWRMDAARLSAAGWRSPEPFVAKGRDGTTDIWGVILRPTNFDPAVRYPVIENIYAGPHGAHVPKRFEPWRAMQGLAELGFIVVQIDGMGTNFRSKAFHDVCWRNIADAGFPDRRAWLLAAAERYPEMDLQRVGIYGTSAGGQSALGALLLHGDFYKVAVASCGCHDNRIDKASWNEQWMGYPVGPHYGEQSNVTLAPRLQGRLLLLVGELDTNVPPESTLQVVDALIRADKDFDLVVLPGQGHTDGGPYGERRRRDFFVRHLWGKEPRKP